MVPWKGPNNTSSETAPPSWRRRSRRLADQHMPALDSIDLRFDNPFVPGGGGRGAADHPEAPPAVKANSAPPLHLRIDDEIWQQAMQMEDAVRESLPLLRAEPAQGPR